MEKPAILMMGGDDSPIRSLRGPLRQRGFEILEFCEKRNALRVFQHMNPDLVMVGSSEKGAREELELVRQIRQRDRKIPVIMIANSSTEELAIEALKAGVNDYFKPPFSCEELAGAIDKWLSDDGTPVAMTECKTSADFIENQRMITRSPLMEEVKNYIGKVASNESNVLITGETGTGKELVAELIHKNGPRHQKPLVCINCAAIPDPLLESELFGYEKGAFTGAHSLNEGKLGFADGGTVFFDEIGDMSPYAQAKILRVIESKELQRLGGRGNISLDIRVIAATNQDLEARVAEGKFREDVYFRLNVARIHLPPLRNRKEDIPLLLEYYIRDMNARFGRQVEGVTEDVLEMLLRYDYPGNIRELKNLLEAVFVNVPSRRICITDLPGSFSCKLKGAESSAKAELDCLLLALSSTDWNRSKAARKLRWSRMTLYRKMAKYHLITSSDKSGKEAEPKVLQAKGPGG